MLHMPEAALKLSYKGQAAQIGHCSPLVWAEDSTQPTQLMCSRSRTNLM